MQEHSALTRTFFLRTNRLVAQLGIDVEDLPALLGMGRRTLFDCRKDDTAVSGKSWAKLEMAERKANLQSAEKCVTAESSTVLKDEAISDPTHAAYAKPREGVPLSIEERMDRVERALQGIAAALEKLVERG